jgi:RNA polymerase sigma factor (sigma-70 family)
MNQPPLKQAQSGDKLAQERLLKEIRPPLIRYLSRRLGNFPMAEDLTQEILLKIYSHLNEASEENFKTWIYQLASQECDALVQEEEPWSPDSLLIFNQYLLDQEGHDLELFEVYANHEENFKIQDHVEFCFSIMSKSLFPQEQNIFLLREDAGLSPNDIGTITGVSPEIVEERAEESRESLSEILWERCSLVRPGAPCEQCQGLGRWLLSGEALDKQLKGLPFSKEETYKSSFSTRMEWILDRGPSQSSSKFFHLKFSQLLWRALGKS